MTYYKTDLNQPYLELLKPLPDSPQALWVRGTLPDCSNARPKTVAIVGARRCTTYGENAAYRLAFELAKMGVIIISGLAYGIDTSAHRGCLDAGGTTIAVLGTPIDQIYPPSNRELAERILEKGAILSEYDPGTEVRNYFFLNRNRIVSGLADVVVVIEAARKSGTHFTASVADHEQGKTVFAMPGDVTRPMSVGCNNLIKEGALVYTELEDVWAALHMTAPEKRKSTYFNLSSAERSVVDSLSSGEKNTIDIIAETKLSTPELIQVLTDLEMKNCIKNAGNDRWTLA